MAKGVKKSKGRKEKTKEKNVKAGDLYVVNTDVEVVDVDGDGLTDVIFTHTVDKNSKKFVNAKIEWLGLGEEVAEMFVGVLADVGLVEEENVEITKFNQVVKYWKKLTKALAKINKLGDLASIEIGEEPEADPEIDEIAE